MIYFWVYIKCQPAVRHYFVPNNVISCFTVPTNDMYPHYYYLNSCILLFISEIVFRKQSVRILVFVILILYYISYLIIYIQCIQTTICSIQFFSFLFEEHAKYRLDVYNLHIPPPPPPVFDRSRKSGRSHCVTIGDIKYS